MHPTCPIEQTVRTEPMQYVQRVEGCGVVEDWHYVPAMDVQIDWVLASDVLPRAAVEFECDASALQVTTIAHEQVAVFGCNQRAIYLLVDGRWIANTQSTLQRGPL